MDENRAQVIFKLEDVLCPDQDAIFAHINGELEVVGKEVFRSDGPQQKGEFAIIEVLGIAMPLVVPLKKLRLLTTQEESAKRHAEVQH